MKGLSLVLIAAMVPLASAAQIARDKKWSVLTLAHPNAKMLIGVDWKKAVSSPLAPVLVRQVQLGGHPLLSFLESIEGIDRLLISSPGEHRSGRKPLLVVADGNFSLNKIRKMAAADGAISKHFNSVELLVPAGATNDDLHFALLDGHTILFGDGFSVKGSIERWQRPGNWADGNPVFARAEILGESQDLWAMIEAPANSMQSLGMAGTPLAEQILQIEAAFQTGETLGTQITIRAETEEAAQILATGLPALLQFAALQYSHQPYLTQVSKRLKVSRDKRTVQMSFSTDARLLDKSFGELRAAAPAMPEDLTPVPISAAAAPAPTPAAPAKPAPMSLAAAPRKVIRIIGAEGGDREIPLE